MQYTLFGRTGVTVSRICLGCMSYGTPEWRPWVLDEEQAMPFFKAPSPVCLSRVSFVEKLVCAPAPFQSPFTGLL